MAMRYCKDCQLYECCMRTPLGGCQVDSVRPELNPPITPEDVRKHMSEQVDGYWEKFRREAAKDILCALIIHCSLPREDGARIAIEYADALIAKLKEK